MNLCDLFLMCSIHSSSSLSIKKGVTRQGNPYSDLGAGNKITLPEAA